MLALGGALIGMLGPGTLPPHMDSALAVGLLVAVVIAWLWWERRRPSGATEAQLRRICSGDERQVERLIEGEMRRTARPISRAEAARHAVERHRRDNR